MFWTDGDIQTASCRHVGPNIYSQARSGNITCLVVTKNRRSFMDIALLQSWPWQQQRECAHGTIAVGERAETSRTSQTQTTSSALCAAAKKN